MNGKILTSNSKDLLSLVKLGWKAGATLIVALSVFGAVLLLHSTNANAWDDNQSPTPTPTPSPQPQNPPSFPKCSDQTGIGDKAHYSSGLHQIVGNGLLEGQDDVYTLSNGNFLQCYVPPAKDVCIQTNWWRTDQVLAGWYSVNGSQWNLGNFHYLAKNLNYNCQPEPTPSPTPTPGTGGTNTNNNSQNQSQTQENNQTVNVTVNQTVTTTGQVEGTKSAKITKQPETGVSVLSMTTMFGILPFGLFLARFGKGRKLIAEQISLASLGNSLVRIRTKGADKV